MTFVLACCQQRALGLAPASEDQPAEREAEAERPEGEAADRERLPDRRKTLPAAERLSLFARQRLAAALLANRAARSKAEVEIVEDLGGLVGHESQSIASPGR